MGSKEQKVVPVPELTVKIKKDQYWYCILNSFLYRVRMVNSFIPKQLTYTDRTSRSWLTGKVCDLQSVEKLAIMSFDNGGHAGFCHYARGKFDGRMLDIFGGDIWKSVKLHDTRDKAIEEYRELMLEDINAKRDRAIRAMEGVIGMMLNVDGVVKTMLKED